MLFTKHSENVTVLETALLAIIWRRAFWFRGVSRQVVPAATKSQRSRGEGSLLRTWAWIVLFYSSGIKSRKSHIQAPPLKRKRGNVCKNGFCSVECMESAP